MSQRARAAARCTGEGRWLASDGQDRESLADALVAEAEQAAVRAFWAEDPTDQLALHARLAAAAAAAAQGVILSWSGIDAWMAWVSYMRPEVAAAAGVCRPQPEQGWAQDGDGVFFDFFGEHERSPLSDAGCQCAPACQRWGRP